MSVEVYRVERRKIFTPSLSAGFFLSMLRNIFLIVT